MYRITVISVISILEITTMGRDVRRRPKLSTTKLERIFALDSSGGTLQLDSSDVKLIVPPGAIPEGTLFSCLLSYVKCRVILINTEWY